MVNAKRLIAEPEVGKPGEWWSLLHVQSHGLCWAQLACSRARGHRIVHRTRAHQALMEAPTRSQEWSCGSQRSAHL